MDTLPVFGTVKQVRMRKRIQNALALKQERLQTFLARRFPDAHICGTDIGYTSLGDELIPAVEMFIKTYGVKESTYSSWDIYTLKHLSPDGVGIPEALNALWSWGRKRMNTLACFLRKER